MVTPFVYRFTPWYHTRVAQDQDQRRSIDRRLSDAIRHIEKHYKDCTLGSVAREFGYDPNYLGNLLKANTGRTFSQIKLAQQMREARFLLTNTDRSITSIAEKVGIANMTYFYRKFGEHFGMSPREYRMSAQAT
jgi:YesN/AraC family two-component response regulator